MDPLSCTQGHSHKSIHTSFMVNTSKPTLQPQHTDWCNLVFFFFSLMLMSKKKKQVSPDAQTALLARQSQ